MLRNLKMPRSKKTIAMFTNTSVHLLATFYLLSIASSYIHVKQNLQVVVDSLLTYT